MLSNTPANGVEATEHVPPRGGVAGLLDLAFGFVVWAVHLLLTYVAVALACVVGMGGASEGARTTFRGVLVLVTVIAAAVTAIHAVRRYRKLRRAVGGRFRMSVTIGGDALSTVAILLQLFPILLVPMCA